MTNSKKLSFSGYTAAGFEPVRKVFEQNFTSHGDHGAAVCAYMDGQKVIDLWGGFSDRACTRLWEADTLVNVWSTTKGWLALAMHMLIDQGLLDINAPVAQYWPEFAQNGKGNVLIKHILTHTAGLPAPSMKVPKDAIYDWDMMVHALERSTLYWTPGTKFGYHALTFGWLNGEVLRRITSLPVGEFLRTQIADPLGADVFIGLSPAEQKRTAEIISPSFLNALRFHLKDELGARSKRMVANNPPRPPRIVNTARWQQAEIPASNGHASARGVARLYALMASGGELDHLRLLSKDEVDLAGLLQVNSRDVIYGSNGTRSLGFSLYSFDPKKPGELTAFGHGGLGGSGGFADPSMRLSMGYVMNRMILGSDQRYSELYRAVYNCL